MNPDVALPDNTNFTEFDEATRELLAQAIRNDEGGLEAAPEIFGQGIAENVENADPLIDERVIGMTDAQLFDAIEGEDVYKPRRAKQKHRQREDGAEGEEQQQQKKRPQKRPAGNGPRQVEASDVLCQANAGEMPGCYFPYSIPDPGARKGWNAVKFNPKTGEEDAEFSALDPIDKVVLHLGRARSRAASAVGIWRKDGRTPFKRVTEEELGTVFGTFLFDMRGSIPDYARIFGDDAEAKALLQAMHVFKTAGMGDAEEMHLPRIMAWDERPALDLGDPANERLFKPIITDAKQSLVDPPFNWDGNDLDAFDWQPPKWAWRNGDGVVKSTGAAKPDKTFRTQYSQTWSYLDLALRHLYEAARQMALRGEDLRKAGTDSQDSRMRRLALLPADVLLLALVANLMPTYMNTTIDVDTPSHQLLASPLDSITRSFALNLKYAPDDVSADPVASRDYRSLKILEIANPGDNGKNSLYSRPVMAIAILTHLMFAPTGKDRTRVREKLWKLNEGRNCLRFGAVLEQASRRGAFSDPSRAAVLLFRPYDFVFTDQTDDLSDYPEWSLPTIVPNKAQYEQPQSQEPVVPGQQNEEEEEEEQEAEPEPEPQPQPAEAEEEFNFDFSWDELMDELAERDRLAEALNDRTLAFRVPDSVTVSELDDNIPDHEFAFFQSERSLYVLPAATIDRLDIDEAIDYIREGMKRDEFVVVPAQPFRDTPLGDYVRFVQRAEYVVVPFPLLSDLHALARISDVIATPQMNKSIGATLGPNGGSQ
jgi:hypothetical protein